MLKITFLGGLFPHEDRAKIYDNSIETFQAAADIMQWRFVEGIEDVFNTTIRVISLPFVGAFPGHYRKPFIKTKSFSHKGDVNDRVEGFCNIAYIKHILMPIRIKSVIKNVMQDLCEYDTNVLIGYSVNMVDAMAYAKKLDPSIITLLIVPDLPQFTSFGKHGCVFNKYKQSRTRNFYDIVRNGKIDKYVFLTEQMADELNVKKNDYVVIEAMTENIVWSCPEHAENEKITVVYTGTLAIEYGVLDLIREFKTINDDRFELIICGGGEASSIIKKECELDHRIKFLGLIAPSEARELQNIADVLVNPRKNNNEFTKYSFPSKIIEYLHSYKPIVCYRLDGIPKEYDEVLYYADELDGGLSTMIKKVALLNSSEKVALSQKIALLLKGKTPQKQCEKIKKVLSEFL